MAIEFTNESRVVVLSNVNHVNRKDGKGTLTFAELVDPVTYQRTGDLLVANTCVLPPTGTSGLATIEIAPFNNRAAMLLSKFQAV